MDITKLTIAPLMPKAAKIEISNPDTAYATKLIKESLFETPYRVSKCKKAKKLPAFLKGFVNPETWVSKFTDVSKGQKSF